MWTSIVGHHQQLEHLTRRLKERKLPHAYLFTGLRGIGKHLVAETFAAALFCDQPSSPCGTCSTCKRIHEHQHPDFFSLAPEGETIKIDQIRSLAADLQFHPLEGRIKLALIDDTDHLTEGASNALLKILEEPPPTTHFILITPLPHRLLATIRSRCQTIAFAPLADDDIARFLEQQDHLSPHEAQLIARVSQGSLGTARRLRPEFLTQTSERLRMLLHKNDASDIIATSELWSQAEAALILEVLMGMYRDALLVTTVPDTTRLLQRKDILPLTAEKADAGLTAIAWARRALDTTANKQLLFEQLLFTLTAS